jgi:hypothetical protein
LGGRDAFVCRIAGGGETAVTFPNANLEAVIRQAIDKPEGDIHESDLSGLTELVAADKGIVDLTGLEYCTSLTYLDLSSNLIADLSPLGGLTGLTWLSLGDNQIGDVSALSALTNLTLLALYSNTVVDVTPLSGLTNLTTLGLDANQVADVSPLVSLANLEHLYLGWNQISDISPLGNLTTLAWLSLSGNDIVDISTLSKLSNLEQLYIWDNRIADISPLSSLTSMMRLELGQNDIVDIAPLSNLTELARLGLGENRIVDVSPLTGLTNLGDLLAWLAPPFEAHLDLSGNRIKDISSLVDNLGLDDGDVLDLRNNPLSGESEAEYIPQLRQRGVEVLWEEWHFIVGISSLVDNAGTAIDDFDFLTPDGLVDVHVGGGTTLLTEGGKPLAYMGVGEVPQQYWPAPPVGDVVIAVFDFAPDGATFAPWVEVTLHYDPDLLPAGSSEDDLAVAFYDDQSRQYQFVTGAVDTANDTVTFHVEHFTVFALVGSLAAPWDVNSDACISVLDIILVGQHFGETGEPCWIPEDVNCDGVISVLDIILIGQHFGEGCLG